MRGPRRAVGAAAWLVPGIVVCALGVLGSRPDVVVVGGAFVLGPVLDRLLGARPGTASVRTARLRARDGAAGRHLAEDVEVVSDAPATVLVRASAPGARASAALVAVDGSRALTASLPLARSGRLPGFTVTAAAWSADHGHVEPLPAPGPSEAVVLPVADRLDALPVPGRLRGLSGPHGSRRPGSGGDLRDVHPFAPGDRMRGIDWRATARRSPTLDEIYVRRTHATSEAHVVLVLDSRDDVDQDLGTWSGTGAARPDRPGSLDLARSAAASLATAYLRRGDRVGLVDLGRGRAQLRPGAGERHLRRVLHALAHAVPDLGTVRRSRAPHVPAGATIVLVSTFLDDDAVDAALGWVAAGHEVAAVDVLPPVGGAAPDGPVGLAWRVLALERSLRLERLRGAGIDLLDWSGPHRPDRGPAPAAALRALSRRRPAGAR